MNKKVSIKNYKGIENIGIKNFEQYNIFVGDNGSYKTTILEAIYIGEDNNIVGVLETIAARGERNFREALKSYSTDNKPIEIVLNDKVISRIEILAGKNNIYLNESFELNSVEGKERIDFFKITKKQDNLKIESILYEEKRKLLIEDLKDNSNITKKSNFVSSFDRDNPFLLKKLERIVREKRKSDILDLIKKFDTTINNIEIINNKIFLDLSTNKELVLMSGLGAGIASILKLLIILLAENKEKSLYIDEIEAGIHYLNYPILSKILIEIASEREMQIFMTTHSDEFLKAFYKALNNNNQIANKNEKLKVYQFQKDKEKIVTYNEYDMEEIKDVVENGWDIR